MMLHTSTIKSTQLAIAVASGANFRSYIPKGETGFWFQDLVREGYFSKKYVSAGSNSCADIDYRNQSAMPITVDGKVVDPGAFVEW